MKRRAFVFTASALGASASGMAGAAGQYQWKYAHGAPLSSFVHVRAIEMTNAIRKESGGRLDIQVFGNSQLGSGAGSLGQVRSGAVEIAALLGGVVGSVSPIAAIDELGFAYGTLRQARSVMDGPLNAYISEVDQRGIALLGYIDYGGFRQTCSSTHPIAKPEDFVGFKIRTPPSKISVDLFRALGSSPSPLNFDITYSALQTRIVDGVEDPLDIIETAHLYEVQKFLSFTNHQYNVLYVCANKDAVAGLPADLRGVLEGNALKYSRLARHDADIQYAALRDKLARRGMILNDTQPAAFRARLAPYYATWKAEFGPAAWAMLEDVTGRLA